MTDAAYIIAGFVTTFGTVVIYALSLQSRRAFLRPVADEAEVIPAHRTSK